MKQQISKIVQRVDWNRIRVYALVAAFATFLMVGSPASAQSASTPNINLDLTPFFDSLNAYLPLFIGFFAIVGGIAGAMALARFIIGAIVRALSGGNI